MLQEINNMAADRIPLKRWTLVDVLIVFILCACTFQGVAGSCTLPDDLRGSWEDSLKGTLTFYNDSITGYNIYLFGSFTLTCYLQNDDIYVMESNSFAFFGLTFNGYLCWSLQKKTSNLYYFYEYSSPLSGAGNEKVRMYIPASPRNYSQICDNTNPGLGTYRVIYRNQTLTSSISTCPSVLQGYFSYSITEGGSNVCTGDISMDGCTSTSYIRSNSQSGNCTTALGYSAGGELGCLIYVTSGSVTYVTLANTDSTVDGSTTYYTTCMIIDKSTSPYQATQYPKQCPDDMNATYIASPGGIISLNLTGSCPTSTNLLWIIAVVLVLLLLIAGGMLCAWYCYRRRKKRQEEEDRKKLEEEEERAREEGRDRDDGEGGDGTDGVGKDKGKGDEYSLTRGEFPPDVTIEVEPPKGVFRKHLSELEDKPGFRSSGDVTPSGIHPTYDNPHKRFSKRRRVWMIGKDGKAIKVWKEGDEDMDPNDSGMEDEDENGDSINGKNGNKFGGRYSGLSDRDKKEKDFFKQFGRQDVKESDELTDKGQLRNTNTKLLNKVKQMAVVRSFSKPLKDRRKSRSRSKSKDGKPYKHSARMTTSTVPTMDSFDDDDFYDDEGSRDRFRDDVVVEEEEVEEDMDPSKHGRRERDELKTSGDKTGSSPDSGKGLDSALSSYSSTSSSDNVRGGVVDGVHHKQGGKQGRDGSRQDKDSRGDGSRQDKDSRGDGSRQDKDSRGDGSRQDKDSRGDGSRQSRRDKADKLGKTGQSSPDSTGDGTKRTDSTGRKTGAGGEVSASGSDESGRTGDPGTGSRGQSKEGEAGEQKSGKGKGLFRGKTVKQTESEKEKDRSGKQAGKQGQGAQGKDGTDDKYDKQGKGRGANEGANDGEQDEQSQSGKEKDDKEGKKGLFGKRKDGTDSNQGLSGKEKDRTDGKKVVFGTGKGETDGKGGLFGKGKDGTDDRKGLFGKGKDGTDDRKGLFGKGKDGTDDKKGLFGKGKDGTDDRKGLFGKGKDGTDDKKGLFGKGKDGTDDKKGLFGKGKDGTDDKKGLFGKGKDGTDDKKGLFGKGKDGTDDKKGLFGKGKGETDGKQGPSGKEKDGEDGKKGLFGKGKSETDGKGGLFGKGKSGMEGKLGLFGKGKGTTDGKQEKQGQLGNGTDKPGGKGDEDNRKGKNAGRDAEDKGTGKKGTGAKGSGVGGSGGDSDGMGLGGASGGGSRGKDTKRGGAGPADTSKNRRDGASVDELDILESTDLLDPRKLDSRTGSNRSSSRTGGKGKGGKGTAWVGGGGTSPKETGTLKSSSGSSRGDSSRPSWTTSTSTDGPSTQMSSRISMGTTVSFLPSSDLSSKDGTRSSRRSGKLSSLASTRDDVTLPSMSSGFISNDSTTFWQDSANGSPPNTGSATDKGGKFGGQASGSDKEVLDHTLLTAVQVTPRRGDSKDGRQRQGKKDQPERGGQRASTRSTQSNNISNQDRGDSTLTSIDIGDPFSHVPAAALESSRPPTNHRRRQGWQEGESARSRSRSPCPRDESQRGRVDRSQSDRATESRSVRWQSEDEEVSMPGTAAEGRRSVRWKQEGSTSVDSRAVPRTSRESSRQYSSSRSYTPSRQSWVYSSMSELVRIHRKKKAVAPELDSENVDDDRRRRLRRPSDMDDLDWRRLLEELYPDKKYLDYAKATSRDKEDDQEEEYLFDKSRQGLKYLYGRAKFWETQEPLVRPGTNLTIQSFNSTSTSSTSSKTPGTPATRGSKDSKHS